MSAPNPFKYPQWMCALEFEVEVQKIADTCAPGSGKARDEVIGLMARCLRSNGFGVGLDAMLELLTEDKTDPVISAAQAAQAVSRSRTETSVSDTGEKTG